MDTFDAIQSRRSTKSFDKNQKNHPARGGQLPQSEIVFENSF